MLFNQIFSSKKVWKSLVFLFCVQNNFTVLSQDIQFDQKSQVEIENSDDRQISPTESQQQSKLAHDPQSQGKNITQKTKVKLRITTRSKGKEATLCQEAINEWMKETGHNVEIITLPHSSNDCFAQYQQWLCAKSSDVDLLQMDIAWVGVFSEFLYDLTQEIPQSLLNDLFPEVVKTITMDNKVIAFPWYIDAGMMFYRKDLLEKYNYQPPETIDKLFEVAKDIQQKESAVGNNIYGFVYQAKAQEILVCNFIEFLNAFGGEIINCSNNIAINTQKTKDALTFMINCIAQKITPLGILNYTEEEARGVFQAGKAVFMRNWPYAWSLLNKEHTAVAGKVGVMPIPSIEPNKKTAALGGWHLCASKYTKHPKEAVELLKYLTSVKQQKQRAIQASYAPAYQSLYKDTEVLQANPFFNQLFQALIFAVKRPFMEFKMNYQQFSSYTFNFIHNMLSKNYKKDKYEIDAEGFSVQLQNLLDLTFKSVKDRQVFEKSNDHIEAVDDPDFCLVQSKMEHLVKKTELESEKSKDSVQLKANDTMADVPNSSEDSSVKALGEKCKTCECIDENCKDQKYKNDKQCNTCEEKNCVKKTSSCQLCSWIGGFFHTICNLFDSKKNC